MRNYPETLLRNARKHLPRHIVTHNYIFIPTSHPPPLSFCLLSTCCSTHHGPARQQSHTPRGGGPYQSPEGEGLLKRGWRKLATLVSAFMTGTKGLYKDVKAVTELKRRHRLVITGCAPNRTGPGTTDLGFNRTELQFIYQTQKDLKKMLPTIVLFFVPFFGYFVPLIVFMYPHRMLSSHFLTSEQKTELQKAATSARAANLSSLLSTDGYSEELRHLETSLNNPEEREGGRGGEDVERESQDGGHLKNVRGQHLENICGMWGVAGGVLPRLLPWLRGSALRSRLESHLRYVFTTDCLIEVEGGPRHLEKKDLEKLCLERCLVSEEEREMEEFLEKWVHISTQFHGQCPQREMFLLSLIHHSVSVHHTCWPICLSCCQNREDIDV